MVIRPQGLRAYGPHSKLEQASKVKVWMPTRPNNGEGRANGEAVDICQAFVDSARCGPSRESCRTAGNPRPMFNPVRKEALLCGAQYCAIIYK